MVAFKEEFPCLRADSGQLFAFDQRWLRDALKRAADEAGYPSWWLTDHVTESIAFYLRLRNDESYVAMTQLSQTVQYVLRVIGYQEIGPHFAPTPPPVSISLFELACAAGAGYELAFFETLARQIALLRQTGVDHVQFIALHACVKHLRHTRVWSRACVTLQSEIVCFVREKLYSDNSSMQLSCSLRG